MIETPLTVLAAACACHRSPGLGITMNMDYLRAHAVDGFCG